MADRRRRRRPQNSESEYSESEENNLRKPKGEGRIRESECESELDDKDGSDYESVSEDVEEDDFTYTEDYSEDGESVIIETDSYYEDESSMFGERESGDGEEQPDRQSELDADEDKKNPAYVPKRGTFYEHDSREGEEGEESEKEKNDARREAKKKLWLESNKWVHDKFDLSQQGPKSRDELVTLYGYDIRAHSEPPESVPFINQRRQRGRDDRNQLGDFIEDRTQDSRPRGGYRGGRGSSRGRGYRGRGRGVPSRSGPRDPPGPPPDRWVDDPRKSYSNYRDRGDRYRQNSGSESFARDTSPNDPNQRRRMQNNARNENEQRQRGYDNESEQYGRRVQNEGKYGRPQNRDNMDNYRQGQNRDKISEPLEKQQQQKSRPFEDRYAGGDNQHTRGTSHTQSRSQDARYDDDFRDKRNFRKAKGFAGNTEEKGLENLMEIAPPLTTIETRTTVSTVRADEGPQRRGGYTQDKRTKKTPPRPREDGDKQSKRELAEKPPRFREQEKTNVQQSRDQRATKRYSTQRQRGVEPGAVESPPPNVNVMVPPPGVQMVTPRAMHPGGDGHQSTLAGRQQGISNPRIVSNQAPGRIAQPAFYGPAPQGVYRQPPPIYRAVTQPPQPGAVTSQRPLMQAVTTHRPVLSQQQQILAQQQALAMQGKVQATAAIAQMSQPTMYTSSQQPRPIMTTARPPPPLVATRPAGPAAGQLMATATPGQQPQPAAQYMAASLVNIATGPPPPPQAYQLPPGQVAAPVAYPATQVPQGAEAVPVSGTPVSPSAQYIAVPQAPLPAQQGSGGSAAPGPGQPPAIHVRGGTTYFHPQIQPVAEGRSPARRAKEPIPIVDPQHEGEGGQPLDEAQYYVDAAYAMQGDAQGYVYYAQHPGVYTNQASEEQHGGFVEASDDQQYIEHNIEHGQKPAQDLEECGEDSGESGPHTLNPEVKEFKQSSVENEESDESTAKLSNDHRSDDEQNIEELEVDTLPKGPSPVVDSKEDQELQAEQQEKSLSSSNPTELDSAITDNDSSLEKVTEKHETAIDEDSDSEQFFEAESADQDKIGVVQKSEEQDKENVQTSSDSCVLNNRMNPVKSQIADAALGKNLESNNTADQSSNQQGLSEENNSVIQDSEELVSKENESVQAVGNENIASDTENYQEKSELESSINGQTNEQTDDLAESSASETLSSNVDIKHTEKQNTENIETKADKLNEKGDLGDCKQLTVNEEKVEIEK